MDLIEAEDTKKRWQEYTEELYKRTILNDPDNYDGVMTHLEPDILEQEVKWALGSITTNKASGGNQTPVELFQILKDDAVKVLHSICQQIWKTQQWPQEFSFQSQRKAMPKNIQTTTCQQRNAQNSPWEASIVLHRELPDVQAGFRKVRGTRDQIANIPWIIEKAREYQKNTYFCFINYAKAFD